MHARSQDVSESIVFVVPSLKIKSLQLIANVGSVSGSTVSWSVGAMVSVGYVVGVGVGVGVGSAVRFCSVLFKFCEFACCAKSRRQIEVEALLHNFDEDFICSNSNAMAECEADNNSVSTYAENE